MTKYMIKCTRNVLIFLALLTMDTVAKQVYILLRVMLMFKVLAYHLHYIYINLFIKCLIQTDIT